MKKLSILFLIILSIFSCKDPEIDVTDAYFMEDSITLYCGEQKRVIFNYFPIDATNVVIEYSVSESANGIIEITNQSNDGCVITGKKSGNCVLIAKCNQITSYMQVNVIGEDEISPYITTTKPTFELFEGNRTSFTASLYGGTGEDNFLFEFSSSDENVVKVETVANNCVINALTDGTAKITIKHPKAKYPSSVQVYVIKPEIRPVYITTSQNTVQLGITDGTRQYSVQLVGSSNNDLSGFVFTIKEGDEVIDIISNNNNVSVTPKTSGIAIIEVTHPECEMSLEMQVIVVKTTIDPYIDSDNNFLVFEDKIGKVVNCFVVGSDNTDINSNFSFVNEDESICKVSQINNSFYIEPLQDGKSKIIVSNSITKYPYEIYVVVQNLNEIIQNHYITTGQNVVIMEVGEEVKLDMLLTGGNESDKNNFNWSIDDGSIIDIITGYGQVNYVTGRNISENLGFDAIIEGKKVGITTIKVSHPKSYDVATVKVKVHPKGTLNNNQIEFSGKSLIKILKGSSIEYSVEQVKGESVSNLIWSIDDSDIAKVSGEGLTCNIEGLESGVTTLRAKHPDMVNDYIVTLMCGTTEELESTVVLYSDNRYPRVFKGSTSYIPIGYIGELGEFSCTINDNNIANVRMIDDVLVISALSEGQTEIVISNGNAVNSLVLFLTVYDEVTVDKPYYFSYDKFIGVVVGATKEINVSLVGALEVDKNSINWSCDDSSIVKIIGNGENCRITGVGLGETIIRASSVKSAKEAEIVVYTAETEEELAQKVVLKAEKSNFLSYVGEDLFVKVNVSDEENNLDKIKWSVDDISILKVDDNKNEAYIRCLKSGNAVITVSCGNVSTKIYVSVKEAGNRDIPEISVVNILETIVGQSLIVRAETNNLTSEDKQNIEWVIEDDSIGTIKGNGDSCYLSILKKGFTRIIVKQKELGIERQIQLISCETYQELASSVVIGLERTYYSLVKGDEIDLNLTYGTNRLSEELETQIKWETDSDIIQIIKNGKKATIKGLKEGVCKVQISGEGIVNVLEVEILVKSVDERTYIDCEKIIGIVKGNKKEFNVSLFSIEGNKINTGYENFEFELEDEGIIKCLQNGDKFELEGIGVGQTYLIIKHPLCLDARVLVYVAETQAELDEYYPLTTNKTHYLLGIGDSANLSLITINDDKVNGIKWSCDNASICTYTGGGKNLIIKAKKSGVCVFTASHENSQKSVMFTVSVTEHNDKITDLHILTESIIDIKIGEQYTTTIQTSIKDVENLLWSVSDESILSIDGDGLKCTLTALKTGNCEITVKYNSVVYRTIYCKVISDSNEKYYAINNDKRYYLLGINDSVTINPFFKNEIANINNTIYEDIYKNNVIDFNSTNGKLKVVGKNEGIGAIRVKNTQCENEFIVFFEVNNEYGGVVEESSNGYLSMTKTIYVLDSLDTMTQHNLQVIPIGIDEIDYKDIKWTINNDCVTLLSNRDSCTMFVNKKGESIISVSHPKSSNILTIKVLVVENKMETYPYIKVKNSIELSNGEEKELDLSVENLDGEIGSKYQFSLSDDIVDYTVNSDGKLVIKAKKGGQAILSVGYDDVYVSNVNIVISVKEVQGELIYLSTDKNYVIITEGAYKTLDAQLNGYNELDASKFIWTIERELPDNNGKVVSISGSGLSVVCNGLGTGISRIKVEHEKCQFPLYFDVRVVDSDSYKPVYIDIDNSVLTLRENDRSTIRVVLKNGLENENSLFSWTTSTPNIISLSGANNECSVQGLSSGVGRITVTHPSSIGQSMDIVIVVEPKLEENSLYISTDSTLIEMKPTDSYKQLNVTLVGGKPEQNVLFNWSILSYESTIKNKDGTSNPVVNILPSQDSCMVTPLTEGNTIIRVTNTATSHYLDIKVIVSTFSKLSFTSNSILIKQYESGFVDVNCPTGKNVIYESSNENIATVSGTGKICVIEGVGKGTCVIKARTSDSSSSDELIVKVEENNDVVSNYITLDINTLNLNTFDNASGQKVKATLNGSGVTASDADNFIWKISSENTQYISFVGTTSYTIKGSEVQIKPVAAGEVSVVVSHPKSRNSKTLYISVEQNEATMELSSTYEVMELGDILGFTCSLSGVSNTQINNIKWTSSNSNVVKIMQGGTGRDCQIEAKGYGEAVITVSYGSMSKYINIYVQEKQNLYLPINNVKMATGQKAQEFEIFVSPKDDYDKVEVTSSATTFVKAEIVKNSSTKTVKLKLTPTQLEGTTTITVKLNDMIARMIVVTSGKIDLILDKYEVYKGNTLKDTVLSPSAIKASASSDTKVRVYYKTEPSNIVLSNENKTYKTTDLNDSFTSNSVDFFTFTKGISDGSSYFDLVPKRAGYGTLNLYSDDVQGVNLDLPICFADELTGTFNITKAKGNATYNSFKSSYDLSNGILNIANSECLEINFNSDMEYSISCNPSSESNGIYYNRNGNTIYVTGQANKDQNSNPSKRTSTVYKGIITITITYPKYFGVDGIYIKSFIVNQEVWK